MPKKVKKTVNKAQKTSDKEKDINTLADFEGNKVYLDLKEQLIKNGNYSPYTEDLLQQYMTFTDIEEELNKNIAIRGVSVYWNNGGGQEGWKKNDSLTELNRVNLQKIKLLGYLGIKAPKPEASEAGEEEYEV